jgi:hypothetical protein
MPAPHAERRTEVFVDELAPHAHLRSLGEILRPQRHLGKRVVEILVDHRRLGDHGAVVHQDRHLAVGIQLQEFRPMLLETQQVDIVADELQVLFLQAQQSLHRIGNRLGVV